MVDNERRKFLAGAGAAALLAGCGDGANNAQSEGTIQVGPPAAILYNAYQGCGGDGSYHDAVKALQQSTGLPLYYMDIIGTIGSADIIPGASPATKRFPNEDDIDRLQRLGLNFGGGLAIVDSRGQLVPGLSYRGYDASMQADAVSGIQAAQSRGM